MRWLSKRAIGLFILLLIIIFGGLLRFYNLNWDDNQHLHPDERFLTMVNTSQVIPKTISQYFDPTSSKLNPANVGHQFFVYGRFPLNFNKWLAVLLNNDNYNSLTIQGRFLSGLVDLLIIILIYKTVKLLVKQSVINNQQSDAIALAASFFYALAVLPVQLSHFYAIDTFLNFFMFASVYFILKLSLTGATRYRLYVSLFLSAVCFGLALACKITAVYILPLNLLLIFLSVINNKKTIISKFIILLLTTSYYLLTTYSILRLADPYLFRSANFFDPWPSQSFTAAIETMKNLSGPDIWYPPAVQWITKPPVIFSLVNLAVFGIGLPYFILVTIGIVWLISKLKSQILNLHLKSKNQELAINNWQLTIILFWVVGFFLYQSTQFVKAMRYFIFLYPFLAIFAGLGLQVVINWLSIIKETLLRYTLYVICFMLLLLWPLMFMTIYFHKHTRVEASQWIYRNLETGSLILGEEWDDPLPLSLPETLGKQFRIDILPVFGMDTPEKWQIMDEKLDKGDYYVLSSNRGWGSIMTVPKKYPKMSQFYRDLLANKTNYKKIKEFKPYYYRFFELPNHWVDESFTVYDHPTVFIFKKLLTI